MENGVIRSSIVNGNITKNYNYFENSTTLDNDFSIVILNATAKWENDQNSNTLKKINLSVKPRRLLALIGSVGAGKVNFLQISYTSVFPEVLKLW